MLPSFFDSVLQLIVRTSTDLPPDVRAAMKTSLHAEPAGTRSSQALTIIAQNIDLAVDGEGAICQDTGMPTFEIRVPVAADQIWMRQQIREAIAEATRRGKLRPNSVDSITGKNSGDNLGPGNADHPFRTMGAGRRRGQAHPQGRRVREHQRAVFGAGRTAASRTGRSHAGRCEEMHSPRGVAGTGKGCSPGAVGVCIGGDRTSGYLHAKEQLFRTLDDVNPDSRLAEVEASIMSTVNTLEIGAMGFGGKVTLIGCKIGALNRLPASFFVSVAYDCWAFRRLGVVLDGSTGAIKSWLYRDPANPIIPMLDQAGFTRTGREVALTDAAQRRRCPGVEGRRRRPGIGPDVHRTRRRPFVSDEACPAGRFERVGAVPLRPGRRERGRTAGASPRPVRPPASAKSRTRAKSSSVTACAR